MKRTVGIAAAVVGAALALAAFRVGAEWGSEYLPTYGTFAMSRGELALRLNLLLLALPAAFLVAWAAARLAERPILDRFDALAGAGRRWEPLLAAWIVLAAWALRTWVLLGAEVTDDENVYELQARLIESGRLSVPSLPAPFREFLDNQFVVNDGRRYGLYFVGHPAYLAAFRALGLADLAGPVAAGATAWLAVAIARRVFGARVAVITGALLAASPFFLLLSATHLSQPTLSLLLAAFTYALVRIEAEPHAARWWMAAAAAAAGGLLVRPQTAVAFALAGLLPLAWSLARRERRPGRWRAPLAGLAVGVAGVALFLWVNLARSGHPLRTGYAAYLEQGNKWLLPVGPVHSLRQVQEALGHLNFWLFGWPVSLLFLPFFERRRMALVLGAMVLAPMAVYAATGVPTVAPVGPVYLGESIPILAILTASGLDRVAVALRERFGRPDLAAAAAALPPLLTLVALVTFLPPQLQGLARSARLVRAPYDLVEGRRLDRAVVFVSKLPGATLAPGSWAYYHRNADPDLADPVIFVKDLGPERNAAFLASLGDRRGFWMGVRDGKFALEPLPAR